jgi:hypothetical protein
MLATGQFKIKLSPLDCYATAIDDVQLGRMSIDKTFTGDLSAKSQGEMLNILSPVKGSAGYVAIEQVNGELNGKKGSFVLQHYGTMSAQGQQLTLEVVPDSATGDLQGLQGKMSIEIEEGLHHYQFQYELQ